LRTELSSRKPNFYCMLEDAPVAEHIPTMTASENWTEVLRCPDCALTGVASLAQSKGNSTIVIDSLPVGFKAVSSQYGDTFYCKACNRPAGAGVRTVGSWFGSLSDFRRH
jgi:hypothetical protein